jgi:hypothetical protein
MSLSWCYLVQIAVDRVGKHCAFGFRSVAESPTVRFRLNKGRPSASFRLAIEGSIIIRVSPTNDPRLPDLSAE